MFDIKSELIRITAEYCRANGINVDAAPQIDKESPLYKSLMRVNQPDHDRHEYDEPRERMSEDDENRMLDARERGRDMRSAK